MRKQKNAIERQQIRQQIMALEKRMEKIPGAFFGDSEYCPVSHTFGDGICVREIFIPAGTLVVGAIHRYEHPNVLLKGEVIVITEQHGRQYLKAPLSMISPPGTKRAVYALTDVTWITFHKIDERDPERIRELIVVQSYEEFEALYGPDLLAIGG